MRARWQRSCVSGAALLGAAAALIAIAPPACSTFESAADPPDGAADGGADSGVDVTASDAADSAVPPICGANNCRVVFVTSGSSDGNLGGAAGADMKCRAAAASSSIADVRARTFHAWLSVAGMTAADANTKDDKPYLRVDGKTVASGWSDLTDGTLILPINLDQNGADVGAAYVWTGTTLAGNLSNNSCNNWTQAGGGDAESGAGQVGRADKTNASWTDGDIEFMATPQCTNTAHLYCFEK